MRKTTLVKSLATLFAVILCFSLSAQIAVAADSSDLPTQTAPTQAPEAQTTPAETTPEETTPVHTAPVEAAPEQPAPAPAVPVETTPTQSPPAQTTPSEADTAQKEQTEASPKETIINEFKAEIIEFVNAEREKAGVSPLSVLDALVGLADTRARESAEIFSHTRPNGTRCFTIFSDNFMKYYAAGENLAYGFKTPEDFVRAWMKSPTHRQNLLDPDFKQIGIGYYQSEETGKIYCSELFYSPKAAA